MSARYPAHVRAYMVALVQVEGCKQREAVAIMRQLGVNVGRSTLSKWCTAASAAPEATLEPTQTPLPMASAWRDDMCQRLRAAQERGDKLQSDLLTARLERDEAIAEGRDLQAAINRMLNGGRIARAARALRGAQ